MKHIKQALEMVADTVSKSQGKIVARQGFFYRHGMTSEKFAERVNAALEKDGVKERVQAHGEKWAAFRGGQTVAQGSHFWAIVG